MLVPRPTGSHVAGAAPKRRAPDALSLNPKSGLSPQQRQLDLQDIQSWFQSGAVQGGLWLPEWAYLAQDSVWTAVTAAGQVAGIWRDATWGGQLGPELVTNGTFDSSVGWTLNTGWSISDGKAMYDGSQASSPIMSDLSMIKSGRLYKITVVCQSNTGVASNTVYLGSTNKVSDAHFAAGEMSFYNASVAGNTILYIYGKLNELLVLDSVSIREVLGNHATQTTTANKPLSSITPQTQLPWLTADATDVLPVVFPSALGSACTIARATPTGVTFTDSQTVGATWNDLVRPNQYNSAVCVLSRAPTAYEKAVLTRVLGRYVPVYPGAELVTNGRFDIDATGWLAVSGYDATISVSGGVATITNTQSVTGRKCSSISTDIGKKYRLSGSIPSAPGSGLIRVANAPDAVGGASILTLGTDGQSDTFVATATTTYVILIVASSVMGSSARFDNISVHEDWV